MDQEMIRSNVPATVSKEDFLAIRSGEVRETPLLFYVCGYKYQSRSHAIYQTFIYPKENIVTDLIVLRTDGWMWISPYFAWDGCSGPTLDNDQNQRAGHCHDGLYALHRMGLLPIDFRPKSDLCLKRLMLNDGASAFRADYYHWAVNHFGESSATEQKTVHCSPVERLIKFIERK